MGPWAELTVVQFTRSVEDSTNTWSPKSARRVYIRNCARQPSNPVVSNAGDVREKELVLFWYWAPNGGLSVMTQPKPPNAGSHSCPHVLLVPPVVHLAPKLPVKCSSNRTLFGHALTM